MPLYPTNARAEATEAQQEPWSPRTHCYTTRGHSPSSDGSTLLIHVSLGLVLCFPGCLSECCAFGKAALKPLRASVSPGGDSCSPCTGSLVGWQQRLACPRPRDTHVSSQEALDHSTFLQNTARCVGRKKAPRNKKPPSHSPSYRSIQGRAAPYEKGTKPPENPEDPPCRSYPGSLGALHPVAAGTSAPSGAD